VEDRTFANTKKSIKTTRKRARREGEGTKREGCRKYNNTKEN